MKPIQSISRLDTYIRQRQLIDQRIVPVSAATLWRMVGKGLFPKPVKVSPGVTAWKVSEVKAWQLAQAEAAVK